MKFKTLEKRRIEKGSKLEQPHYWFAWFPIVTDDGYWVWLEYVSRKRKLGVRWYHTPWNKWFYDLIR